MPVCPYFTFCLHLYSPFSSFLCYFFGAVFSLTLLLASFAFYLLPSTVPFSPMADITQGSCQLLSDSSCFLSRIWLLFSPRGHPPMNQLTHEMTTSYHLDSRRKKKKPPGGDQIGPTLFSPCASALGFPFPEFRCSCDKPFVKACLHGSCQRRPCLLEAYILSDLEITPTVIVQPRKPCLLTFLKVSQQPSVPPPPHPEWSKPCWADPSALVSVTVTEMCLGNAEAATSFSRMEIWAPERKGQRGCE